MAIDLQQRELPRMPRHARPVEPRTRKNSGLARMRNMNWNWLTTSLVWLRNFIVSFISQRIDNLVRVESFIVQFISKWSIGMGVFFFSPLLAVVFGVAYAGLQALLGDPFPTPNLLTWENLAHAAMETVQDQLEERPSIEMSMILKDPPPC